ncbi:transcriptional regulator [Bradyrhizobium prioriisuperbiae]|uniref:transcriptional regulator n=1 Tax=Bradyrhizobium prioriisuperbiae TaxID=2854389 RepID=UPI0028E6C080|nr:transcriptional regulator [Bradyrhizobium prioritasuperba]
MESAQENRTVETLQVRLLGALTVIRDGKTMALPASRKVRALLAYLALAPRAVPRSQLCDLLWDVPNDPRGELRWCLSKLRAIIDTPERRRVETSGDTVRLDLSDAFVDAITITRAVQSGLATLPPVQLRALATLCAGEFLDGFEIDRNPSFNTWLTAQRRQFRGRHAAVLEQLAGSVDENEMMGVLEAWLALAPLDPRVHEKLLQAFARRGQLREGDDHLAATVQLFDADGLDVAPLHAMWRIAKANAGTAPKAHVIDTSPPEMAAAVSAGRPLDGPRRASIAVMPFVERATATDHPAAGLPGGLADGLVHDVITRLAKLRSLFVIAEGTVFALGERRIGAEEAGRMLNVDYVVSGSLRRQGSRLTVSIELSETRTARIVWAEVFDQAIDNAFIVLDDIGNRIVSSIAGEIETVERNRAILKPPNSLDAWEAHHRGLWHMYRFNKEDNARAQHFFETAIRLDPTFARAYGGLSFAHFQNAFQGWAPRERETISAFDAAGQSLMADDRDPMAHWAMGRALWLRGAHDQSIVELSQAVDLSPNFAQGQYALAFVHSQSGDPQAAVTFSDQSRQLSPFDPMLFAMLGARAMALARLGRFEEAAEFAVKAAARPNAHAQILAIAAYCLALASRLDDARRYLAEIHKTRAGYDIHDFLTAMQFDPDSVALFRGAAKRIGG